MSRADADDAARRRPRSGATLLDPPGAIPAELTAELRSHSPSLRALYRVAAVVLASLVPLVVIAGLWLRDEVGRGQRLLEEELRDRALALSQRVDAELGRQISVLQAVAAMPSLDEPNLEQFHRAAGRIARSLPQWTAVALLDPATGRQLVNTGQALGADLPASTMPDAVRQAAQGRPVVRVRPPGEAAVASPGHLIMIFVPVVRAAGGPLVVAAAMRADAFQAVLGLDADPRFQAFVIDAAGRLVARVPGPAPEGTPAPPGLTGLGPPLGVGFLPLVEADGQRLAAAFARSGTADWLSVAATDRRRLAALTGRSTWATVVTAVVALTLVAVLTVFLLHSVVQRRLADERLAAAEALTALDARLLTTTQQSLEDQRRAGQEREVLLREIYHRVKNNLQIVQSLLRLGSRHLTAEQREPFEGAVRRIGAMARVHTLLYASSDLESLDLRDYLEGLAAELAAAFGAETRGITIQLEGEPLRISLDTAVPLAFIAVEILTNAFKHAFPGDRRGRIQVSVRREEGEGVLAISDDGVGLPGSGGPRGLGLTIIEKLVQQIEGRIDPPQPGASTYVVRFPLRALAPPRIPPDAKPSGPLPSPSSERVPAPSP